ncbi:MAG TPA: phage major capsid protein [Allosphingosinicella sp.]|jgi:HK97 family phage major capsid protein
MKKMTHAALLAAGAAIVTPRAIAGQRVRMDATDPKVLIEQIQAAVKEMRDVNDQRLKTIEAKVDPLDVEKLNALATTVTELQASLDAQAKQFAAARLGGGDVTPFQDPDYSKKFATYFRDGTGEAEIKAAQKTGIRAALSEGSSANGGYTTPVEWDRTITDALKLVSPIRQEAAVIQISTVGFSRVYNDRSVGSGWVGETASRPATTTPGLTSLTWAIGEIYANAAASQDLLDDSLIDISAWLTSEIEYEFARQEGIAFLSGDGTNKPNGLLTYVTGGANAATHPFGAITTTASGATGAITTDKVVDLVYSLPTMFQPNAKFFMNRASFGTIMKLKNGQGNYIWQPSFQAGQPSTLMAAPVVELPDMPAVATGNAALLYGDMRRTYLIVDRMGVRTLRDPYTNKPYVQFYTTKRVGGGVNNPQAMKAMVIA